ncbi:MAG: hypothetical protein WC547_04470, partial [Candidatus Omnitrophota bacterium]
PANMPDLASGKRTLTLTAKWTTDPLHVYASVTIFMYDIKIQNKPAGDMLIIGGPSHPFGTNVLAQTPTSDSLPANDANMAFTITQGGSFGTFPTFGTYQPAASILSDPPYVGTIRLQYKDTIIPEGADDFYDTYSFTLLPQVRIIAENTTQGKSWTAQGSGSYGNAEVAVSQSLRLTAEAIGVPASVSHSFQWSIANEGPALLDALTDPDPTDIYMTYTAAPTFTIGFLNERQRRISATWNSDARSQQYLYIYPGSAVAKTIAINKGTSTSFTLPVSGFFQERTLQNFMQPVNGNIFSFTRLPGGNIDFGGLAYVTIGNTVVTCGELRYTGPVNSGNCDPTLASCTVNAGFTYVASATACGPITVRVYPYADTRYFVNLSLQSKEVIVNPCTGCPDPKKSCCGTSTGGTTF